MHKANFKYGKEFNFSSKNNNMQEMIAKSQVNNKNSNNAIKSKSICSFAYQMFMKGNNTNFIFNFDKILSIFRV